MKKQLQTRVVLLLKILSPFFIIDKEILIFDLTFKKTIKYINKETT